MEQSPQFFPFEWYPAFEDFIHRYAAGTPTIQSEQIRGLPGCFDYPRYGSEPWLEFSLTIEALKPTCPALDNKHYLKSALLELKRGVKQYLKQFPKQAQDLLPLIIDNLEKVFSALFGPLLGLSYSIWPIYIGAWGNSAETVLEYVDFLSEEDSNQVYDKLCLAAEYAVLGYRNPAVNIIEQLLNPRSKTSVAQSLGLEHCYDRISRQPATPENPGAYDPCLTEAARWEELEG